MQEWKLVGRISGGTHRMPANMKRTDQRHILIVNCGTKKQKQKWELEFGVGIIMGNDTVNALKIAFAVQDSLDKAR